MEWHPRHQGNHIRSPSYDFSITFDGAFNQENNKNMRIQGYISGDEQGGIYIGEKLGIVLGEQQWLLCKGRGA